MAKNKISLYLVKAHINDVASIFKDGYAVLHEYSEKKVLYYNPSFVKPPKWLNDFFNIRNESLKIASSKAVLLVRRTINQRECLFVLTFGNGLYMLKDNIVEPRFGLITLLNLIGENKIKRINKTNIGGNKKVSDEQVPTTTNINDFGFQINQDLLKKAYARIDDEVLGKCIVEGGSLFNLSVENTVDNIDTIIDYCFQTYKKEDYKRQYDWIDNIAPVKDKTLTNNLNSKLVDEINEKNNEKVMFALPDLIEWENIDGFKYSGDLITIYDDINLDTFISKYEPFDSIEEIKNKRVHSVSANDGTILMSWSAYKCIFADIEYGGKQYCISDRNWYEINSDFVNSVNQRYNQIRKSEFRLPNYNHKDEGTYNNGIIDELDNIISLDRQIVMYGGGQSKFEICDILSLDKKIIHVKHNRGSSCMSHLFNQATVSAELLTELSFRILANQKIREISDEYLIEEDFNPRDYTVIIAIIDRYEDELPRIPFFSKVAIRYAAQRIQAFGYNVEIMKIQNVKEKETQEETEDA